jgi:hypothetical protein
MKDDQKLRPARLEWREGRRDPGPRIGECTRLTISTARSDAR